MTEEGQISQPIRVWAGEGNRLLSAVRKGECYAYVATITDRIEIDPQVMLGKPVIRGTRITVELILRKLSEGMTEAELLDAYPRLTPQDIRAAIGYAADTLAHEETLILAPPEAKPGT